MIAKLFLDHPKSVDETYLEHMGVATSFGTRMILAGLACLVHGLVPAWFTTTGSATIRELHRRMVTHRRRHPEAEPAADVWAAAGI